MAGFQNVFSQNGALIAIPWGPASESPLNSNHAQTTGMLNTEACQLQNVWEVSSADLFKGLLSCWSCWSLCCCYCCCWTSAAVSKLSSQKSSEQHTKDVRADSKIWNDLDVGWAGGQEIVYIFPLSASSLSCLLVFFVLCIIIMVILRPCS